MELLLVSAILAVMLGIVLSATIFLSKAETQRTQYAHQQRIVRKWKQIISNDLQSVIQDTEQLNKAVGTETIRHFGVVGTSTQLRIDISDYSWRSAESSELRTIFYEFHPICGFVRQERDYAALKSVEGAKEETPEIIKGQFRYLDGGTWHDQWASLDRKRVPSAVEVTFYSLPRTEAGRWRQRIPGSSEPVLNQVIIQIPAAAQGYFEAYQRAQASRPPLEDLLPPPPAPPALPRPPTPPPPSPFHSLFGDDGL